MFILSCPFFNGFIAIMVLILDDNSEIGALVKSNIRYVICLWYLIKSTVTNRIFFRKTFSFMRARHVLALLVKTLNTALLTGKIRILIFPFSTSKISRSFLRIFSVHVCLLACVSVCVLVYVCACVCVCVCVCGCVCVCVCTSV